MIASFPGSPSCHAIIPRMTFDPPEGKAEGEPGRFCHIAGESSEEMVGNVCMGACQLVDFVQAKIVRVQ